MNIAVLLGEVAFVSQKNMMKGILDEALIDNSNVYLFTCEGGQFEHDRENIDAEYNIFSLPDLSTYDGVIVELDTIHDKHTYEMLVQKLNKLEVPCVSINTELASQNSYTIKMENELGIYNLVEHLVNEHGVQEMVYVSGPAKNIDAKERLEAFMKCTKKYGIDIDEDRVLYGDFAYITGKKRVEEYLEAGNDVPQAFVVANDDMAIGVVDALHKAGYSIPEDVIVTGYDNINMARCIEPRLTTVIRGEYEAGKMAYSALRNGLPSEKKGKEIIYGKNIFSSSCGCPVNKNRDRKKMMLDLLKNQIHMNNNLEFLKRTTVEFSNMNSFGDFVTCIRRYIESMDIDFFYLCICGNEQMHEEDLNRMSAGKRLDRDVTKYTENAYIPLAYEEGVWNKYDEYDISQLLPEACKNKDKGIYYLVLPVHHRERCLGYCLVGNYKDVPQGKFIQHLVLNINNGLGNIIKQDVMHRMLEQINKKWVYDEMTGIYNRNGLWKNAPALIQTAKDRKESVAAIFVDLDGLKTVNDELGHEAGDMYIKSMAHILRDSANENDILVRYGGDEYVIVLSAVSKKYVEQYIENVRLYIKDFNRKKANLKISASIGYAYEDDLDGLDIKRLIENADQEMYEEKKTKKHRT